MKNKNAIFISYRREDSRWTTRAAAEKLVAHFGKDKVFLDVEAIAGGHDFIEAIDNALAQSGALLVFIGDNWVANKQGRRRLEDPKDIVRKEIATALEQKLLIVPILIDDAKMPSEQDLPSDLEALHSRDAMHLRHADFRRDMELLIDRLGEELNVSMAAVPWLDMPWQERRDPVHSAQWLRYWHRHAEFVGREKEKSQLKEFFESDERFSWYAITGPGGIGKSRLALECLLVLGTDWHSGFLKEEDRKSVEWRRWRPQLAKAIVVDYAAQDPDWLVEWLDILCRTHFEYPVRVLLIERATHVRDREEQYWWKRLTTGRGSAMDRVETFHELDEHRAPRPLAIMPFSETTQGLLLRSFLQATNEEIKIPPEEDVEFWKNMDQLTQGGRPLYIGMVAAAIVVEGIDHIRHWHVGDLLERALQRELEIWTDASHRKPTDKLARHAVRLIAIATACAGLNIRDEAAAHHVKACLDTAHLLDNDVNTRDLYTTAATMTSGHTYSLAPDVLGEYFLITRQWRTPSTEEIDELVQLRADLLCAWDISPLGCAQTINRAIDDFPDESRTTVRWLSLLIEERSEQVIHAFLLALVAVDAMNVYGAVQHRSVLKQLYQTSPYSQKSASFFGHFTYSSHSAPKIVADR
jgi:TIR domain